MNPQLQDFTRTLSEIQESSVKFALKNMGKIRVYPECANPEEIFDEFYEFQFNSYMSLVSLRGSVLQGKNISELEKTEFNKTLDEVILKYQTTLNQGLNASLSKKIV